MARILQHTAATISATFSIDGEVPDPAPASATVEITHVDGSLLVEETAATSEGDGSFSYVLTAEDTSQLTELSARWTATIDGQPSSITTSIEIVGGFYFTIGEFRASYQGNDEVAALSADQIADARATAEDIIEGLDTEEGCHQAFVLRAETFEVDGGRRISIPRYRVRSINAVTIDGEDQDIGGLWLDGRNIFGAEWAGPISVTVTHGWNTPPRRVKDAAILLAYHRAVKGPIDDRATGRLTPEGSVLTLSTPGRPGIVTGIPEVDATIRQYRLRRLRPTSIYAGEPRSTPPGNWRDGVWP